MPRLGVFCEYSFRILLLKSGLLINVKIILKIEDDLQVVLKMSCFVGHPVPHFKRNVT